MTLYELLPDGFLFHLAYFLGRASHAADMTERTLLTPGKPVEIPFERSYMTGRRLEAGSRLLLRLDVVKDPWHQVNHGTGGDVSEESAEDAGEPLRVRWHGDSFMEIPIRR